MRHTLRYNDVCKKVLEVCDFEGILVRSFRLGSCIQNIINIRTSKRAESLPSVVCHQEA